MIPDEQLATDVGPDRLAIAYERRGDPSHPTALLLMGIATQLVHWPTGFLDALVARGLHVVRFDHRDSGRSTHIDGGPAPDLPGALAGDRSSAAYTLSDMAADAVGLIDALGVRSAHLVGVSLGGAVAQTIAIEHPARVRSLTTMMSTTGDTAVGQVHPATAQALFGSPPPTTREEAIATALRTATILGSPVFPVDTAELATIAGLAWDRDQDVVAIARQAVATVVSGDRTERLRHLDIPTLVVHGLADTLCDPSGGRATAAAIPGAELLEIEGLSHSLPPGVHARVADAIAALVERAEARAHGRERSP